MIYNQFDVIKVPFPFTDSDNSKRRPAVIISNSEYQVQNNHVILAMITSAKQSKWIDDIDITNLESIGLRSASKIRMKIFSLDQRFIVGRLGLLAEFDRNKLQKQLKTLFLVNN